MATALGQPTTNGNCTWTAHHKWQLHFDSPQMATALGQPTMATALKDSPQWQLHLTPTHTIHACFGLAMSALPLPTGHDVLQPNSPYPSMQAVTGEASTDQAIIG